MNAAYVPALAALAGSMIGALASFATTWLAQTSQDRAQRFAQAMARRERLYGDFVDEAAKLFAEAMTRELDDPTRLVHLYATVSKLRLFASDDVVSKAEEVLDRIVDTYYRPNPDFSSIDKFEEHKFDLLRAFSEQCREDLGR